MLFVAGEIFVWILLAFIVGIGVGWAARSRRTGSTSRAVRRRFR
jgi:hypothetical protein